ncbi:hypothetical protein THAR02_03173 [Trichoderma harzianum]|uniref:Zn(2)-C6 fungal-type domain-containing protein n=1 Tax=Trichoderma harzianum TaxID=5544 RepID=A0A0F9XXF8_TRIHA|nr:hypothetical protein THAR02_03173 [Trichoderma harzianum]
MASPSTSMAASTAATTTTTTTTASTSTASRRQSCDRCHGQKLRCTRASGSNTGACNRCLRQNARCVYSFSLPKGRPSMYRLHMENSSSSSISRTSSASNLAAAATATATATAISASATSSSASSAFNQPSTSPATPEPILSNPKTVVADGDCGNGSGNGKHSSPPPGNINCSGNDDPPSLTCPMDTDAATTISTDTSDTSIWSWLAEPFNWGDMQIDMDGEQHHDSNRPTSTMDLHQTMMDGIHQLSDAVDMAAFPDAAFPYIQDWGLKHVETRTASPAHLQKVPEQHLHQQPQHQQQSQAARPQMHLAPDDGIAQLSQLSMRLYPLHRTCCTLAETVESLIQSRDFGQNQILSSLLVDDATFKLVAQWLVQVSADSSSLLLRPEASKNQTPTPCAGAVTLGNTLLDAFSASCYFLQIMQCMPVDSSFWPNGTGPLPTPTSMPGSLDSNTAYLDQAACGSNSNNGLALSSSLSSSSSSSPSSFSRTLNQGQYSNTVMRHLVIACHTLLLNIFVVVFTALQLDGDLRNSSRGSVMPNSNGGVDPEPHPDAGLADIRLVMIVQLCSYLTERQCRAVHSYLSPLSQSSPQQPSQVSSQQLFETPQHQAGSLPASLPNTHATSAEVIELEMEVRYRIVRLRQTLLI